MSVKSIVHEEEVQLLASAPSLGPESHLRGNEPYTLEECGSTPRSAWAVGKALGWGLQLCMTVIPYPRSWKSRIEAWGLAPPEASFFGS